MGTNMRCWLNHMALDPATWTDPTDKHPATAASSSSSDKEEEEEEEEGQGEKEGQRPSKSRARIKLRAATGLTAADYFGGSISGPARHSMFLWGKLIMELSHVGYDDDSMHMAAYDWRLSPQQLEERDHYFTRLKVRKEGMAPGRIRGRKEGRNGLYQVFQAGRQAGRQLARVG